MAKHEEQNSLSIALLGGFSVSVGGREIGDGDWSSRKARSLVKLLASTQGHRLHREQAMEALWPAIEATSASASLRKAIHFARHVLDPSSPPATHLYLQARDDQLLLTSPAELSVDADAFREAAASARRAATPALYTQAISLYTGDLLPEDPYEEWTIVPREELRNTYLLLLQEVSRLYESTGQYEAGIEALRKAVSAEPLNEEAQAGLIRLLAQAGQSAQAIRQYRSFSAALERDIAGAPGEATQRLYKEIAEGRFPSGPSPERAAPQGQRPKHNLSPQLTSFIGRTREIAEVEALLARARLLTLTGAGGSGKTRLALEVAARLVDSYPNGVWLAELAGLADPGLVPQAVASALGVRDQPGRPLLYTLADYLQSKHLLIILDNCEHLVAACAELAETLLRACPALQILATSREALNIGGEITWLVPSLSLPDADHKGDLGEALASDPARYEAVHLFTERAASVSSAFRLAVRDAPAVAQICLRLDGIPLAIELAAARVKVLSVAQIAGRLDDSFQLLAGGSRTALPRHQTLKATVDWSYSLLTGKESALFRRLSVFAGGFTLNAVEAVCAGEPIEQYEALDVLSHLVEKSLVVVLEAEQGGARRYRLLETLRQYGRERLAESGESGDMTARHARHYALLCASAEPQLFGPAQVEWLDRLNIELDNLRAALDWCRLHDPSMGLLLAGSITRFWDMRGYLTEGRRWLDDLLAVVPHRTSLRAKGLYTSGNLTSRQGYNEPAIPMMEESAAIYEEIGDQAGMAWALERLGIAEALIGGVEKGLAYSERSVSIFRHIGYKAGLGYALGSLGMNARTEGRYARAREALQEAYAITREVGDLNGSAYALNNLGQLARLEGDYEKAWAMLLECLELSERIGHKPFNCFTLECLSTVARMRGDYAAGWTMLERSLQVAREIGIMRHLARCIYSFAILAIHYGQIVKSVKLFGAAMSLQPVVKLSLDEDEVAEWDGALAKARAQLSDADFVQAWDIGSAMTAEQASDLALEGGPSPIQTAG